MMIPVALSNALLDALKAKCELDAGRGPPEHRHPTTEGHRRGSSQAGDSSLTPNQFFKLRTRRVSELHGRRNWPGKPFLGRPPFQGRTSLMGATKARRERPCADARRAGTACHAALLWESAEHLVTASGALGPI